MAHPSEGPNLVLCLTVSALLIAGFIWAVLANRVDPVSGRPRWRWLPGSLDPNDKTTMPRRSRTVDRLELMFAGTLWGLLFIVIVASIMFALDYCFRFSGR